MKRKSFLIYRLAALLLALTVATSAMAMAKYIWTEEDELFWVSYSQAVRDGVAAFSATMPGYYAFYIIGGAGGASSATSTGYGGAGGRVTGVVKVSAGQTLSFTAGTGGAAGNNPGISGGSGNGGAGTGASGSGGGYSLLSLDSSVVAIAGGGGGTSDDGGGPGVSPKSGGAGGGGAAATDSNTSTGAAPVQSPLTWNYGTGAVTIGSYRVAPGQNGQYGTLVNGGRGGDNPTTSNTVNPVTSGTRAGGNSSGDNRGAGGAGYTGGGYGGWAIGGTDGSGGGGSSAINTTLVEHINVPSGIPGWTGTWANPGPIGGNSTTGAVRNNGKGYFYYLGPIDPSLTPGGANF